jgi:hypothetical protein
MPWEKGRLGSSILTNTVELLSQSHLTDLVSWKRWLEAQLPELDLKKSQFHLTDLASWKPPRAGRRTTS